MFLLAAVFWLLAIIVGALLHFAAIASRDTEILSLKRQAAKRDAELHTAKAKLADGERKHINLRKIIDGYKIEVDDQKDIIAILKAKLTKTEGELAQLKQTVGRREGAIRHAMVTPQAAVCGASQRALMTPASIGFGSPPGIAGSEVATVCRQGPTGQPATIQRLQQAQQTAVRLSNENETLRSEVHGLHAEVTRLIDEVDTLRNHKDVLEAQVARLEEENSALGQQVAEHLSIAELRSQELQDAQKLLQEREVDIQGFNTQVVALQSTVSDLKEEIERITTESNEKARDKRVKFAAKMNHAHAELKAARNALVKHEQEIVALRAEIASRSAECAARAATDAERDSKIVELQGELQVLSQKHEDAEQLVRTAVALQAALDLARHKYETSIAEWLRENNELGLTLDELDTALGGLDASLEPCSTLVATLQRAINESGDGSPGAQGLGSALEEMERVVGALDEQLQANKNRCALLQARCDQDAAEIERLRGLLAASENAAEVAAAELKRMRAALDESSATAASSQAEVVILRDENIHLRSDVEQLRLQQAQIQAVVDDLQTQLQAMTRQATACDKTRAILEAKLAERRAKSVEQVEELREESAASQSAVAQQQAENPTLNQDATTPPTSPLASLVLCQSVQEADIAELRRQLRFVERERDRLEALVRAAQSGQNDAIVALAAVHAGAVEVTQAARMVKQVAVSAMEAEAEAQSAVSSHLASCAGEQAATVLLAAARAQAKEVVKTIQTGTKQQTFAAEVASADVEAPVSTLSVNLENTGNARSVVETATQTGQEMTAANMKAEVAIAAQIAAWAGEQAAIELLAAARADKDTAVATMEIARAAEREAVMAKEAAQKEAEEIAAALSEARAEIKVAATAMKTAAAEAQDARTAMDEAVLRELAALRAAAAARTETDAVVSSFLAASAGEQAATALLATARADTQQAVSEAEAARASEQVAHAAMAAAKAEALDAWKAKEAAQADAQVLVAAHVSALAAEQAATMLLAAAQTEARAAMEAARKAEQRAASSESEARAHKESLMKAIEVAQAEGAAALAAMQADNMAIATKLEASKAEAQAAAAAFIAASAAEQAATALLASVHAERSKALKEVERLQAVIDCQCHETAAQQLGTEQRLAEVRRVESKRMAEFSARLAMVEQNGHAAAGAMASLKRLLDAQLGVVLNVIPSEAATCEFADSSTERTGIEGLHELEARVAHIGDLVSLVASNFTSFVRQLSELPHVGARAPFGMHSKHFEYVEAQLLKKDSEIEQLAADLHESLSMLEARDKELAVLRSAAELVIHAAASAKKTLSKEHAAQGDEAKSAASPIRMYDLTGAGAQTPEGSVGSGGSAGEVTPVRDQDSSKRRRRLWGAPRRPAASQEAGRSLTAVPEVGRTSWTVLEAAEAAEAASSLVGTGAEWEDEAWVETGVDKEEIQRSTAVEDASHVNEVENEAGVERNEIRALSRQQLSQPGGEPRLLGQDSPSWQSTQLTHEDDDEEKVNSMSQLILDLTSLPAQISAMRASNVDAEEKVAELMSVRERDLRELQICAVRARQLAVAASGGVTARASRRTTRSSAGTPLSAFRSQSLDPSRGVAEDIQSRQVLVAAAAAVAVAAAAGAMVPVSPGASETTPSEGTGAWSPLAMAASETVQPMEVAHGGSSSDSSSMGVTVLSNHQDVPAGVEEAESDDRTSTVPTAAGNLTRFGPQVSPFMEHLEELRQQLNDLAEANEAALRLEAAAEEERLALVEEAAELRRLLLQTQHDVASEANRANDYRCELNALEEQRDALRKEVIRLQADAAALKMDAERLYAANADFEAVVEAAQARAVHLSAAYGDLQQVAEGAQAKVARLSAANAELTEQAEAAQAEADRLSAAYAEAKGAAEAAQAEVGRLSSANAEMTQQAEAAQVEATQLSAVYAEAKGAAEAAQAEVARLSPANAEMTEQAEAAQAEMGRLSAANAELTEQAEAAQAEMGRLSAVNAELMEQAEAAQAEADRLSAANAELTEQAEAAQAEADRLSAANAELKEAVEAAQVDATRLQLASAEFEQTAESANEAAAHLQVANAELQRMSESSQMEVARLSAANAELQQVAIAAQAEVERLSAEDAELKQALEAAQMEAERLSSTKSELQLLLGAAQAEAKRLQVASTEFEQRYEAAQGVAAQLQCANDELRQMSNVAQAEASGLSAANAALQQAVSTAQTETERLHASHAEALVEAALLQSEVQELQASIDGLRTDLAALQQDTDNLQAERRELVAAVEAANAELEAQKVLTVEVQAEYSALVASKDSLQVSFDSLSAAKVALQSAIENLTAEKDDLVATHAVQQAVIKELEAAQEASQLEAGCLQAERDEVQARNAELADQLLKLQSAEVAANSILAEVQAANTAMETEILGLQDDNSRLQVMVEDLRKGQAEAQSRANELQASLIATDARVSQLMTERAEVLEQVAQLQAAHTTAQSAAVAHQAESEELRSALVGVRETLTLKEGSLTKLQGEHDAVLEHVAQLRAACDAAATEHQALQHQVQLLKEQVKELSSLNDELAAEKIELQERLGSEKADLQVEVEAKTAQSEKLQAEMAGLADEVAQLHEQLERMAAEKAAVESSLADASSRLAKATARLPALWEEIRLKSNLAEELEAKLETLSEAHTELRAQHETLTAAHLELKTECVLLRAQHDALTMEHGELVTAHDDVRAAHHELNTAHAGLLALKDTLSASRRVLTAQCAALTVSSEQLKMTNEELLGQHADLQSQLGALAAQHEEHATAYQALMVVHEGLVEQHNALVAGNGEVTAAHAELTAAHQQLKSQHVALTATQAALRQSLSAACEQLLLLLSKCEQLATEELQRSTELSALKVHHEMIVEAKAVEAQLRSALEAANSDLEDVSGEMKALRTALSTAEAEVARLGGDVAAASAAQQTAADELVTLRAAAAGADAAMRAELLAAETAAQKALLEVASLRSSLQVAESEISRLQSELAAAAKNEQELVAVRADARTAADQVQRLRDALQSMTSQRDEALVERGQAREALQASMEEVNRLQAVMQQRQRQYEALSRTRQDELLARIHEKAVECCDLRQRLQETEVQRVAAQDAVNKLRNLNNDLIRQVANLKQQQVSKPCPTPTADLPAVLASLECSTGDMMRLLHAVTPRKQPQASSDREVGPRAPPSSGDVSPRAAGRPLLPPTSILFGNAAARSPKTPTNAALVRSDQEVEAAAVNDDTLQPAVPPALPIAAKEDQAADVEEPVPGAGPLAAVKTDGGGDAGATSDPSSASSDSALSSLAGSPMLPPLPSGVPLDRGGCGGRMTAGFVNPTFAYSPYPGGMAMTPSLLNPYTHSGNAGSRLQPGQDTLHVELDAGLASDVNMPSPGMPFGFSMSFGNGAAGSRVSPLQSSVSAPLAAAAGRPMPPRGSSGGSGAEQLAYEMPFDVHGLMISLVGRVLGQIRALSEAVGGVVDGAVETPSKAA